MKLFYLSQDQVGGYDTYDSCVVVAQNAEEARKIPPSYGRDWGKTWAKTPDKVEAREIGEAHPNLKEGEVVIASFNAG